MLIAACSVRPNCLLYLVSIVVLSHPILCPVVREWRASMWEKSVGLCKSSLERASFTFL